MAGSAVPSDPSLGRRDRSSAGRGFRLRRVAGKALRVRDGPSAHSSPDPPRPDESRLWGAARSMWPSLAGPTSRSRRRRSGSGAGSGVNRGSLSSRRAPPPSGRSDVSTVTDQQVAMMRLSRGRVVGVPAAGPLIVRGRRTQLARLNISCRRRPAAPADDVRQLTSDDPHLLCGPSGREARGTPEKRPEPETEGADRSPRGAPMPAAGSSARPAICPSRAEVPGRDSR
jgi:hypothetical protein